MKIKVSELTAEAFAPYGTYANSHAGYGEGSISFLPDRIIQMTGGTLNSLCSIRLKYRPFVITDTEYHNDCEELFGGFNNDVIFHVCRMTKQLEPDLDTLRVFRLPAGCFCRVKRGVLHHAPFAIEPGQVTDGIVMLPPTTYTIDCETLCFDTPVEIEIYE